MTTDNTPRAEFDAYAGSYDADLNKGISVSGEDKEFFARGRMQWLARCLRQLHTQPRSALDYGCGTGSAVPWLLESLGVESVTGVDVSEKLLEGAQATYGSERTHFFPFNNYRPRDEFDLAFCNGVFHHIPPAERPAAIDYIRYGLRDGGLFALWENNPWNPGTRLVMRRIPFDRDAITLSSAETQQLLRTNGFQIIRVDFLFIFPRMLHWLRGLEPRVSRLPLGAQYQVLARKCS